MSASTDPELLDLSLHVLEEQGAGLRTHVAILSGLICAVAVRANPIEWVLAWYLCVVGARELRAWSVKRIVRSASMPLMDRHFWVVVWNGVLGLVNGLGALFIVNLPPAEGAFATLMLLSWAAAGVATNATVMPAFYAYVFPIVGLTAMVLALPGDWVSIAAAGLALGFIGVQAQLATRTNRTFEESFFMRRQNILLAKRLEDERNRAHKAREDAEGASRGKSRFLASASHDLRQPLQALALNSAALTSYELPGAARGLAQDMRASVTVLSNMLDGLLEVSHLDAGGLVLQPKTVDLRTVLAALVVNFGPASRARRLGLEMSDLATGPSTVWVDPDALLRVLTNLIDNAIKYTNEGSVRLELCSVGMGLGVSVVDTGIGIAPEDQGRVFDELVQVQNLQRDRRAGYGLGLSIVKRLTTSLGLDLSLESELGKGSRFTLVFPPDSVRQATPSPDSGVASKIELLGARFLCVDDQEEVVESYRRLLDAWGAVALCAGTSAQAVTIAEREPVDGVILDYRLSESENGLTLLRRLRAIRPGLAAILCTADRSPDIELACEEARVPLLRKPISAERLRTALSLMTNRANLNGDSDV